MSFGPQKNCFKWSGRISWLCQVAARTFFMPNSRALVRQNLLFGFDHVTHNRRPAYSGQEEPWGLGAMTAPTMLLLKEVYLTTPAY